MPTIYIALVISSVLSRVSRPVFVAQLLLLIMIFLFTELIPGLPSDPTTFVGLAYLFWKILEVIFDTFRGWMIISATCGYDCDWSENISLWYSFNCLLGSCGQAPTELEHARSIIGVLLEESKFSEFRSYHNNAFYKYFVVSFWKQEM